MNKIFIKRPKFMTIGNRTSKDIAFYQANAIFKKFISGSTTNRLKLE